MSTHTTIHFVVTGRVHGVFFRASCKNFADQNLITGWVRNLADGRVEGVATGKVSCIELMRDWLSRGPKLAKVIQLEIQEQPVLHFNNFEIR